VSRVTIADVAKAAKVSKTTVSFAFNNPGQLSEATRKRVEAVARKLRYVPHPAARSLSTKRSGSVGLLTPQPLETVFANPFVSELIQGIGEVCAEHDLTLLLVPPLNGSLESAIARAPVDGFISLGLNAGDPTLQSLNRLDLPCILVDAEAPGSTGVNIDDYAGAASAARHLIELGHDSIVIVGLGPPGFDHGRHGIGAQRLKGYRDAIRQAGLPRPRMVSAGVSFAAGGAAFKQLYRDGSKPTAVLCMNDIAAIGVMAAARAAGLLLPHDLSVVGYDDIPMAAWVNPPLTTVRQPIAEKGRLAARLLVARMKGKAVAAPQPLATQLIVRESTARPPA
jgi:alanine racemase